MKQVGIIPPVPCEVDKGTPPTLGSGRNVQIRKLQGEWLVYAEGRLSFTFYVSPASRYAGHNYT